MCLVFRHLVTVVTFNIYTFFNTFCVFHFLSAYTYSLPKFSCSLCIVVNTNLGKACEKSQRFPSDIVRVASVCSPTEACTASVMVEEVKW